MKMSAVRVGMRLRPRDDYGFRIYGPATVTEITPEGFKYDLDEDVPGCPMPLMTTLAKEHHHYGLDGEALFEPLENEMTDSGTRV